MLFRETVAVCCGNHTEHTDTLCGQNAEFQYVTAGGTYCNHFALNGYSKRTWYISQLCVLSGRPMRNRTVAFIAWPVGLITLNCSKFIDQLSDYQRLE
jgi:hypothetical protein